MKTNNAAIVIATFNRPENIEKLLKESCIPEGTTIAVSSASNKDNVAKERQVLQKFPQYERIYISSDDYEQHIVKAITAAAKEPGIEQVLTNYGYGIGRQIGYVALMMRHEVMKNELPAAVMTIDDDHVLPENYVSNMAKSMGRTMAEIKTEMLPGRNVFFSGSTNKPVKAIAGYYLWLEHLGFLETSIPGIENIVQKPGVPPSAIRNGLDLLAGYSLDPVSAYYSDAKTGEVLLTEISKCPLFETGKSATGKTYFGGGNYAFAGELLAGMAFKGPCSGSTRYVDDQLLFWGIFPGLTESKGGIAMWSNSDTFSNLHYPGKRDAITGIESDLKGRIAMYALSKDFKPTSDDLELSDSFARISDGFLSRRYDSIAAEVKNEYLERLEKLHTRFKGLSGLIRPIDASLPEGYAQLFEEQAARFGNFMERYNEEVNRIRAKSFEPGDYAPLFTKLSNQYALRSKIAYSIPQVSHELENEFRNILTVK